MPTALITGITGQDGSYLAEFLLGRARRTSSASRISGTASISARPTSSTSSR